jgi:activating signal cointegrator complex subunit 1
VVEKVIQRINNVIEPITDTKSSDTRDQALRPLVASAVDLARQLVVQKAVFKVIMPEILPHQKITFDPALMEDLGGEEEEGLDQREISCITFPGIIKTGDETGGHLQFQNVIVKARALCSPE